MDGRQTWSGWRQIEKRCESCGCTEERQDRRQTEEGRNSGYGLRFLTGFIAI